MGTKYVIKLHRDRHYRGTGERMGNKLMDLNKKWVSFIKILVLICYLERF